MTENILDSGSTEVDGGQPSSQVASQSVKPGSGNVSQPQGEVEERLKRIEKMLSSFQSGKDRGIDKVSNENAELRKSLGELQAMMKKGLSEEEAFAELGSRKADEEFRSAVLELRDTLKGSGSPSAQASGAFDPTEVILDLGLEPNDPVVKAAFAGKQFTVEQAEATAARILREKKKQPIPTSAQTPSIPATPAREASIEAMTEDYKKDMRAARGNPSALNAIKEKYFKQGVKIHEVDFS